MRYYQVQARNGYYAIDEHTDQESGVRGPIVIVTTRKLAEEICTALNEAYAKGIFDAKVCSRETRPTHVDT